MHFTHILCPSIITKFSPGLNATYIPGICCVVLLCCPRGIGGLPHECLAGIPGLLFLHQDFAGTFCFQFLIFSSSFLQCSFFRGRRGKEGLLFVKVSGNKTFCVSRVEHSAFLNRGWFTPEDY